MRKFFSLCFSLCLLQKAFSLSISCEDAERIGEKIWKNECAGSYEKLTHWNKGENFASLGIGHFIWYPKNKKERFQETFPDLLVYVKKKGGELPTWLKTTKECPWNSREEFYADIHSPEMQTLREFLFDTRNLQAGFIADRLESVIQQILEKCPMHVLDKIKKSFSRLAKDPKGLFAMIDYLNFKGAGTSSKETYKGEGWGLLQVLQEMPENSSSAIEDFVNSAKKVLERRIKNSPQDRNESQWLKGWYKRVEGYLE